MARRRSQLGRAHEPSQRAHGVQDRYQRLRLEIQVRPRSSRIEVAPRAPGVLAVRVTEPAVDGRATEAALVAIAAAFGLKRDAVRLVAGRRSRVKIVEVDDLDRVDPAVILAFGLEPIVTGCDSGS